MRSAITLCACLLTASLAHAQSSVVLFGIVDVGVQHLKAGGTGSLTRLTSGNQSTSRLGFRGTEDLGSGLTAAFWLEGQVNADDGSGPLNFQRRATVGLIGPWGEVRAGRDVSAHAYSFVLFDPFTSGGVGHMSDVIFAQGVFRHAAALRSSNSIGYFLPQIPGGFYGNAMIALGGNSSDTPRTATTSNTNGDYWGVRLGWKREAIDVAVGYGHAKYATAPAGTAFTGDFKNINVGGRYTAPGGVAVSGIVSQEIRENGIGQQAKNVGYAIALMVPVGPHEFKAQYSAVDQNALAGNFDGRKYSAGYVYNLSKRTSFYTAVGRVRNLNGSSIYSLAVFNAQPAFNAAPGGTVTGVDMGFKHSF